MIYMKICPITQAGCNSQMIEWQVSETPIHKHLFHIISVAMVKVFICVIYWYFFFLIILIFRWCLIFKYMYLYIFIPHCSLIKLKICIIIPSYMFIQFSVIVEQGSSSTKFSVQHVQSLIFVYFNPIERLTFNTEVFIL